MPRAHITNFPQGWPKLVQSAVLAEPRAQPPAVVLASLLPLRATVASAATTIEVQSAYPFADGGSVRVSAAQPTTLKVRIPGWADAATVDGTPVRNGSFAAVACAAGTTLVVVDLRPSVRIERGWGDRLASPPADAVAVVRGPLVFALHPRERKEVVRSYATEPAHVGHHAPDFLIRTDEPWSYALELEGAAPKPRFVGTPSGNWSAAFAFDDSGDRYPFAIKLAARRVRTWGYWRGSNITEPPPPSPVEPAACAPATELTLVPFGSTNIRISVFPWVRGGRC